MRSGSWRPRSPPAFSGRSGSGSARTSPTTLRAPVRRGRRGDAGRVRSEFDVWRVYIDPQYIDYLVEIWQGRWGDKRIFEWLTNRLRPACWMVRNYTDAMTSGDVSHNGDEVFTRHIKNAVRRKQNVYDDDHRQMHTISKDRPNSPRKIDGAMAGAVVVGVPGRCDRGERAASPSSVYEDRYAAA
jgi:hypothetical protein